MTVPLPSHTFTYKVDPSGCHLDCDVYVPSTIPKPCPVIIWMHYSGLVFDNRNCVGSHMFHSGPIRGYIVVNIDYRLAPQAQIQDIYEDVEDCATWIREILPAKLGPGVVDTGKLIIGGGSCGAQLALTAGIHMKPPPTAVISLYALCDPTDPIFSTATKPNPPPGRDTLISYAEVEEYIGPDAPVVSHPETSLNIPDFKYWGRAKAYFYMLQEGTYLQSVYGSLTKAEIDAKWAIPQNMTGEFPPSFVAHAQSDRFVPHKESEKLVEALRKSGVQHKWWSIPGDHDHGFDAWDMQAGEKTDFEKEFADQLWPWLDTIMKAV
ncbi:hypothetical protein ASPFODRAFT_38374 [Aspergillus luchuensis CBS 106.47]|uniref:Alpha/beta hydrolase fold-3 domain-containing protein n=1 Tax=Aspergillus luchuensis (strain CBS 106.47) TaxID=1137211 RepID=A0A1M3T0A7_ASPLC|nr:hypothetical protein ASPFODRAFT_38374 [Aspergillus luchuensis CBS 106.47]